MPQVKFLLKQREYSEVGDVKGKGRTTVNGVIKTLEKMVELPYEAIPRVGDVISENGYDCEFDSCGWGVLSGKADYFFPDVKRRLKVKERILSWNEKYRKFHYTVELQELRD